MTQALYAHMNDKKIKIKKKRKVVELRGKSSLISTPIFPY
jgi:hypothetical protein